MSLAALGLAAHPGLGWSWSWPSPRELTPQSYSREMRGGERRYTHTYTHAYTHHALTTSRTKHNLTFPMVKW